MSTRQEIDGGTQPGVGALLAGRYLLDELVGRGGMASVYRATDRALGRTVAIKLFSPELADADGARRQREEISLLASLSHPSLVTLFDAATDDQDPPGREFLVMEFVDGTDLRLRLRDGPLDSRTVALVGADVADALDYIHDRGVVHRDVKPGNILLPAPGSAMTRANAKLADFGIARIIDGTRLTATGSLIGTASYLSPEQARGEALGPPSDVYSLGLVLLEALTGERAFPGSAMEATAARLSRDPAIPDRLGSGWVELLRGMTAADPEARPAAAIAEVMLRTLAADGGTGDSTIVMPIATEVSTEPITGNDPPVNAGNEPGPTAEPRGNRRVPPVVWAILGVIALVPLAWAGIAQLAPLAPEQPGEPVPVEYPAIDGELGEHLEQLQRTVEP